MAVFRPPSLLEKEVTPVSTYHGIHILPNAGANGYSIYRHFGAGNDHLVNAGSIHPIPGEFTKLAVLLDKETEKLAPEFDSSYVGHLGRSHYTIKLFETRKNAYDRHYSDIAEDIFSSHDKKLIDELTRISAERRAKEHTPEPVQKVQENNCDVEIYRLIENPYKTFKDNYNRDVQRAIKFLHFEYAGRISAHVPDVHLLIGSINEKIEKEFERNPELLKRLKHPPAVPSREFHGPFRTY